MLSRAMMLTFQGRELADTIRLNVFIFFPTLINGLLFLFESLIDLD